MVPVFLAYFATLFGIGLLFTRDTLSAIIMYSMVSITTTLFYVFNLSPDVAITEAATGSAISTIFFILALTACKQKRESRRGTVVAISALIACLIMFIIFVYLSTKLQQYGDPNNTIHKGIAAHYIKNAAKDFGIPNIVTAILAGYRGLDTLFETAVIFVAALGVKTILSENDK